ncbi:MAG: GNAT family N-acetyltransferase, partial [Terriglobia bacterium]
MDEIEIRHNIPHHRFEAGTPPELAKLDYRIDANTVALYHTEVPRNLQRAGLGGKLAHAALEWARDAGLKVIPS